LARCGCRERRVMAARGAERRGVPGHPAGGQGCVAGHQFKRRDSLPQAIGQVVMPLAQHTFERRLLVRDPARVAVRKRADPSRKAPISAAPSTVGAHSSRNQENCPDPQRCGAAQAARCASRTNRSLQPASLAFGVPAISGGPTQCSSSPKLTSAPSAKPARGLSAPLLTPPSNTFSERAVQGPRHVAGRQPP
jgi:hypothetical protein